MPIQPGTRLGPYEVLAAIGAGGMGEVYRARDTSLDRDVAIKVLPEAFASDPERLARFEREAKVLASLNHPNIGGIHGLERSGDTRALVLELVEGPTLADRIAQGPIPVDEALPIAKQIAEALEAAHEQGIIHRDLKPANIKLRPDGTVKVLDFGLAKAFEREQSKVDQASSPTLTAAASQLGVIMGTAAYMSPEQARGGLVDRRSDIWAFGVVLYEMLTGRQLFDGQTVSDMLASVLKTDPDWTALPAVTPSAVGRLLRRCLDRDHRERLQHIGDARVEIKEAQTESTTATSLNGGAPRRGYRPYILGLTGLVLVLCATVVALNWLELEPRVAPVARAAIPLSSAAPLATDLYQPAVAVSPDGTKLVYTAQVDGMPELHLRRLEQFESVPIPGTRGGTGPFFAPDGERVGFFLNDQLMQVSLSDGRVTPVSDIAREGSRRMMIATMGPALGASWSADDTIVFSTNAGLFQVSAAGGAPNRLHGAAMWPQVLPGGRNVLVTLLNRGSFSDADIGVLSLDTEEVTLLGESGMGARYAASGHLVFVRDSSLLAVPLDLDQLEIRGEAVTVVEDVMANQLNGSTHFSVSRTGALVFVGAGTMERALVWVDREGQIEPLPFEPGLYADPRIAPDGQSLAVTIDGEDVWRFDLARGSRVRLTDAVGLNFEPIWTPDGSRVVFSSTRAGVSNLYWTLSDGRGEIGRLTEGDLRQYASSWTADGTSLLFSVYTEADQTVQTWMLELSTGETTALVASPRFNSFTAQLSPDDRWVAYVSDESGQREVYVQSYPGLDVKIPISTNGGTEPVWSPDGRELFYRSGDAMLAVTLSSETPRTVSAPTQLFDGPFESSAPGYPYYDVSLDGQRFVMIQRSDTTSGLDRQVNLVLNWFQELKARVPTP